VAGTAAALIHRSEPPRSGLVSTDDNDPSAEPFWRLSHFAGLLRDGYITWNAMPWVRVGHRQER